MTIFVFTALLFLFSLFAGFLGALTGFGGAVVIIPVLVLIFKIDIHYAMGAALISVIATSSGTTAVYVKNGYTNLRIGMFLETAAIVGALAGALLIPYVSTSFLTIVFSALLFFSAYLSLRRKEEKENYQTSHPLAVKLKLDGSYPHKHQQVNYHVQRAPLAFCLMGFAGLLSGLLGVGSGALKVLSMDQAMRLPYKVSTTTSNFMIGMTAAVSAGIYFANGYINPVIAFPVMLGVLAGALVGTKVLTKVHTRVLRIIFSVVVCFLAAEMLYKVVVG